MRLLLSFLFCLCGLVSLYAQTEAKHPMTKQTNPPDANPQYFPVGLFSKYRPLSEWRARWYAGELRDLEEPSLRRGKITSGTVYRFLLIPPFTPSLVVRLTVNPDGTGNLIATLGTRRSRGGETTPTQQALSLTPDQVNKFLNLVREANFWSLPSARPEESQVRFADGKEWLLEGKESSKYHVVNRSDNATEVGFSLACNYLQELSPLKTETGHRKRSTIQQPLPTPDRTRNVRRVTAGVRQPH
jgi:hypothetical protein